ncbi:MAG TPA: VanW family protein [Pseudonocardiaceae bacterium]
MRPDRSDPTPAPPAPAEAETEAERTVVLRPLSSSGAAGDVPPAASHPSGGPPSEGHPTGGHPVDGHQDEAYPADGPAGPPAAVGPDDGDDGSGGGNQVTGGDGRRRRLALVLGAVAGFLVLLYGLDLLVSQGEIPRGVTVAGVDVGGMERAAAEQRLREEIGPRLDKPVPVRAGDVEAEIDPQAAGLQLDWAATLEQVGDQPLNPFTRLMSFFTTREVGVVTTADRDKVVQTLEELRGTVDREPAEGTIRFEGTEPVAVDPKPGQKLDVSGAADAVLARWAYGSPVELPVTTTPVTTTPEGVRQALEEVAKPAVSGPLTVLGEGKNATVSPEVIATALTFTPNPSGGLDPQVDTAKLAEAAKPQLASTEQPGKDAEIVLEGGKPVIKPSQDGRGIDYEKSFASVLDVLKRTDDRTVKAEYAEQPAEFTTEQAEQLGIKEVISTFTTHNFAPDSGHNIRRAAQQLNGAIVKPGETFSMNGHTGPRTKATGYIEAGIIENGKPGRAVGGGVSQMATTLYNAAYFAGMDDVEHKEHSYYISRYPMGREATVFQDPSGRSIIDVKFRNPTQTGILIETIWTPSSITVRLWGTKTYQVESITGQPFDQTPPPTVEVSDAGCKPSNGGPGFKVTDTRIIRDLNGREVKRQTRTVRYNPQPKIVCTAAAAQTQENN